MSPAGDILFWVRTTSQARFPVEEISLASDDHVGDLADRQRCGKAGDQFPIGGLGVALLPSTGVDGQGSGPRLLDQAGNLGCIDLGFPPTRADLHGDGDRDPLRKGPEMQQAQLLKSEYQDWPPSALPLLRLSFHLYRHLRQMHLFYC